MKIVYGIIILIIFILCLILFYTNYHTKKHESFKNDFSDYNTIDRIKTADNNYAYCLAGKVVCPTGNLITVNDKYSGGTTYSYACDNSGVFGKYAECQDNFAYNMKGTQIDWKTPTARELSFPFSDVYKGFTMPYSYVPVKINGNYMFFNDTNGNVLDNVNKCDMLLTDEITESCKAALIANAKKEADAAAAAAAASLSSTNSTNSNNSTNSGGSGDSGSGDGGSGDGGSGDGGSGDSESGFWVNSGESKFWVNSDELGFWVNSSDSCPSKEGSEKKCIANYGAKTGDPLCCGQTGVLQKWSSDYVCPSSAPTCSGYSCGDKYGTCS